MHGGYNEDVGLLAPHSWLEGVKKAVIQQASYILQWNKQKAADD